ARGCERTPSAQAGEQPPERVCSAPIVVAARSLANVDETDRENPVFLRRNDMTNQKPIREFRLGSVRAAVWQNALESGRLMYSVSFSRLYKEDGAWRDSASFGRSELPLVARVAGMALDWIYAQPSGENAQATDE